MVQPVVNVVVAGGDAVVGRTLELLLGSAQYRVGFVPGSLLSEPGMLEEADLLVLAPGLTDEQKATVLTDPSSDPAAGARSVARVPVVELVPDLREATGAGEFRLVPWPCRAEELQRQIRTALAGVQGAGVEEEG